MNSPNSALMTAFSFFSDSDDSARRLNRKGTSGHLAEIEMKHKNDDDCLKNVKIHTLFPIEEQKFVRLALCRKKKLDDQSIFEPIRQTVRQSGSQSVKQSDSHRQSVSQPGS